MRFLRKQKNVNTEAVYKMITDTGNGFYVWNGKLYQSDIVRSCIKPKTKAVGKLIAKHVRETVTENGKKIDINPVPYIRFLLEEPNEYMSGQMMLEKVANQLALNNNAFILILRDNFGHPAGLYPIPCTSVEAKYNEVGSLNLKFYMLNGKTLTFPYTEIIHIRDDYFHNDIFGENPAEALTQIMNVVGTIDQGIINAVKNGGVIRWLLKYMTALRPEDLKRNAQEFADNYLAMSSGSLGVAATDSKAEAVQVKPNDYVPNAAQADRQVKRIYDFFNTNEKIVNSTYSENEWISYYEAVIEPLAEQLSNEFTRKLFTRKERSFGNRILFESSNLTYASMSTKLQLVQYVDQGVMTPNEVRYYLNLAPIDGGDTALLRKDTGKLGDEQGGDDD
ncbi:MAG: phage portal protein [Lachnospiraceae bacterium]|nr:phage portal protein [Lachnospiraceae bacterium]